MGNYEDLLWAGIIVYHPDFIKLGRLINTLENQVNMLIIFNNGGCFDEDLFKLFHGRNFQIINRGENVGIGKAVNIICDLASKNDAEYVVTFDQDSLPNIDFVDEMLKMMKSLCDANKKVAAVGPVFVDNRSKNELFPVFQAGRYWIKKKYPLSGISAALNTTMLITSGMLLSLSAWRKIGGYRENFFIDHLDTEWCLRAINCGYELFVCPTVVMQHELSDESPKRVFGRLILKYSPIRRYYTFRNSTILIMESNTSQGLRNYLLATIGYRFFVNLIIDDYKIKSLRAMLTGVAHGLTGKMSRWDDAN